MEIKIKDNSWHAQIFEYWIGYPSKLPDNLCPYFWTTLGFCLLTIPLVIFALPIILFNTLRKLIMPNQNSWVDSVMEDTAKDLVVLQMVVYFGIMALFVFVSLEIIFIKTFILGNPIPENVVVLNYVSLIVNLGYLFLLLRYGIPFVFRKYFKPSVNKDGKQITGTGTLMVEAIKAKYNKVCPRITWIKNNES